MTGDELRLLLIAALPRVAEARDELRDLDAAIGDGDLGVTVGRRGAGGRRGPGRPAGRCDPGHGPADGRDDPRPGEPVDLLGAGHGRAPGGLEGARRRAGRRLRRRPAGGAGRRPSPSRPAASPRSATRPSSTRWCRASTPRPPRRTRPLPAAITAAREGVERTRDLVSQRGRAAWVGERTAGHADGGATAWVRVLERRAELDHARRASLRRVLPGGRQAIGVVVRVRAWTLGATRRRRPTRGSRARRTCHGWRVLSG